MSQISKSSSSSVASNVIAVTNPGAYPYQVLSTDNAIIVNTTTARTITAPAAPATGFTFIIKDGTGNAGTNAITIQGNGHNIDGQTSFTIQTNSGFASFLYNGTQWNQIN